jgi:uncharacterized protein
MGGRASTRAHDDPPGGGPPSRRVVIAGGTGLIGRALTISLLRDGIEVDVLTRDVKAGAHRLIDGARAVGWDPADPAGVAPLSRVLAGANAVVNVSGVPVGPLPWTPGRKRAIVASRVGTTDRLTEAIVSLEATARPPALVCAAGIDGYTGLDATPATESTDTSLTAGFLAQLGRDWEAAAERAALLGVRVVMVRTAFVLARDSDLLRLLALPVRLGLGGRYGDGRQWFSWIHLDDLVAIYRRAIDDATLAGPVNAASPEPSRQRDVAVALARVLHRPNWLPVPAWLLRLGLRGQATLLLGSRRVVPARLLETRFHYAYPDLNAALEDALGPIDRGRRTPE